MTPRFVPAALAAALAFASPVLACDEEPDPVACQRQTPPAMDPAEARAYAQAIQQAAGMVGDATAQQLAQRHGLSILNVTWEDTGRSKGSSVGPNISDMTIQVGQTCMPVIRTPNFEDTTADVALDEFQVMVGNERGQPLRRVSLRELLSNLRRYLSLPTSWGGAGRSLVCERDSHALVSAQACFLPVPKSGSAEFNPVLFNYQSRAGDPAVMTILVTREGTSVTVIDPARGERWGSGQRLFFNQAGQRASFTGQRMSDFKASGQTATNGAALVKGDPNGGLNQVLLIQIPLKQKTPPQRDELECCEDSAGAPAACAPTMARSRGGDVEEAVVGHGKVEGPFTELGGLAIERDERFPIRVTVQLYKATSDGVVNPTDLSTIREQLDAVYEKGDAMGSLVTEGQTGRPTEAYAANGLPAWWSGAWAQHSRATGRPVAELQARLLDAMGEWVPSSPQELEAALRQLDLLSPDTQASIVEPVVDRCGTGVVRTCGTRSLPSRTGEVAAKVLGGVAALGAALFALTRIFA